MEAEDDFFGDMSDSLFKAKNEDEQRQEKLVAKQQNKLANSSVHKNCFRGDQSKDEKNAMKKKTRQRKRNERKVKAKDRKKEWLQAMSEEERNAWIDENGKKVLQEKRSAHEKLMKGKATGLNVVIDCGFEDQMNVKELKSLAQQLNYVHLRMKKSENLFRLALINFKGNFPEISMERNIPNWTFADLEAGDIDDYVQQRKLAYDSLVYLSPDADEELEGFEDGKVYIIGGIVDTTVNLNQTRQKAKHMQIQLRKLPLDQFRKVNHFRPCLNINTVFYIIDNYRSSRDMTNAILDALPERFREEYLDKPKTKLEAQTDTIEEKQTAAEEQMEST